ncbi:ArgR family transcriptional regulator [Treponema sp. HNW]|uniref:arginine repressor n=1 Tax=Treponema sp. HNW TaxID=3116654 RepID=UPI003D138128
MKNRLTRLENIRTLIKNRRIESQEELLIHLQQEGYTVTQATLSRDLKLLKVGKVADGSGGYMYTLSEEKTQSPEHLYARDFLRGYTSIQCSGNMAVIKTHSGHSNTVAEALDCFNIDGVLGTIAGDNCIFVCLSEGVSGKDFLHSLKEKIPELSE